MLLNFLFQAEIKWAKISKVECKSKANFQTILNFKIEIKKMNKIKMDTAKKSFKQSIFNTQA